MATYSFKNPLNKPKKLVASLTMGMTKKIHEGD